MEQASFGELGRNIISLVELAALGKWPEAEALHVKAMRQVSSLKEKRREKHSAEIRKRLDKCSCRCGNLLSAVLTASGRWQQVEIILTEMSLVAQRTLHEGDAEVLESIQNLVEVLERHGNLQEAEKISSKAVQICRRCFEGDHAYTLTSQNNLATVLQEQGKWQEAEEMHREVLEARRRVLGEIHPDTLGSMTSLANVRQMRDREDWQFRCSLDEPGHAGRVNDAISAVRKAIEGLQDRADDDHPHLLGWRFALAELLLQMNTANCLQEAEDLLQKLVPALQNRYGPEHPLVQTATRDLVFLLEEVGKDAEEWRLNLLRREEEADGAAVLSVEEVFRDSLPGEDEDRERWEEATDLLRDLLLKPRTISGGQIVKAANTSDATSSQARDAPAASASDPASQPSHALVLKPGSSSRSCESSYATSSDSSALWKAALEEKQKERAEREKLPSRDESWIFGTWTDAQGARTTTKQRDRFLLRGMALQMMFGRDSLF